MRRWSSSHRAIRQPFYLLHIVPSFRFNKWILCLHNILSNFNIWSSIILKCSRLNRARSKRRADIPRSLSTSWSFLKHLISCPFLSKISTQSWVWMEMPHIIVLFINYLCSIRLSEDSLPAWWAGYSLWATKRRYFSSNMDSRFNSVLELQVLINSLLFILCIESQNIPSVWLHFQAHEIFCFHFSNQASQWHAFYRSAILRTLCDQIFIANYVAFFKAEKIYLCMFKIACSFQFCRSTDLVRFHRIAKYLFSLLPWIFIVEHCASHFKLPLFDKINWVSRFSLPVKELTFDCLNIMKLRTDLYHWVSCYTIKVW